MKSITRNVSILSAVALMAVAGVSSPASAQSIFASPQAAHAAGMGANYVNQVRGNAIAGGGASSTYSAPAYTPSSPMDPGTGTDPYAAIFSQIQTAASGLLSGPGALAFGVLILGLGFGVAWRLVTKGVKSIAK